MYISLADSLAKGFRKWADAHQLDSKIDDHARGGDVVHLADLEEIGEVHDPSGNRFDYDLARSPEDGGR